MITITYRPTANTLTAYVPYDRLNRFTKINIESVLLPYTRVLKRDTEKLCFIIEIKPPHSDLQALIMHYQKYKESVNFVIVK